ncbi:MAG: 3-hydroxyacyl-CoA dehydrogenase family protein [Dehalococcoidia bacterium]|nr:3-hydroxyacyl-CoA dehydrogenase family protein [Dehalococcoidia bacterium]
MELKDVRRIAIIGAGIMGHGIAQTFATSGYSVTVTDTNRDALDTLFDRIGKNLATFVEAGLVTEASVPEILRRIRVAATLEEAGSDADVVIEAALEDFDVKRALFNRMDAACPPHAILASNSSSLLISDFASEVHGQDRCILTHWMNPPHIVPAVEVIPGRHTSEETYELMCALLLKVGKQPVRVRKEIPGFLVNRIQMAMMREIWSLWDQGVASAEDLDMAVMGSFGFRLPSLGPLLSNDLAGADTSLRVGSLILPHIDNSTTPAEGFRAMIEAGNYGLKTGSGFFSHTPDEWADIVEKRDRILLRRLKCLYG